MGKEMKEKSDREHKYHLFGWILFIICAMFFLASSLKNQDILTCIGSIVFLIACIVFLIPLVVTHKKQVKRTRTHEDKTAI